MSPWVLSRNAKRSLAAAWFALFAFLAASVFFLRPHVKFSVLCLYVLLPALAAAIAGYVWGGPILDFSRSGAALQSALRGVGVTAAAFLIFAVLYALGLPLVERGWEIKQAGGILIAALTLGLVMVGPVILIAGMIAGATLYVLGRRAFTERGGQAPDHPAV